MSATVSIEAGSVEPSRPGSRTAAFLHGPIVPTLLRLSWPNILVMLAQSSTGLIET
jgi:Na+-driven multidrug efflux pump